MTCWALRFLFDADAAAHVFLPKQTALVSVADTAAYIFRSDGDDDGVTVTAGARGVTATRRR